MSAESAPPLNEIQIMLLRLFSRTMTDLEMQAVQELLLNYYEKELQAELTRTIREKNITREDFDQLLQKQQRTR